MSHSSDRAGTSWLLRHLNSLAQWKWKQPLTPKHTASGTSSSRVRAAGQAGQCMASVFDFVGLPLLSTVPTCIGSPSSAKVSLVVGRELCISSRLSNGEAPSSAKSVSLIVVLEPAAVSGAGTVIGCPLRRTSSHSGDSTNGAGHPCRSHSFCKAS